MKEEYSVISLKKKHLHASDTDTAGYYSFAWMANVSKLGGEFPNIWFCIISEAISGDTAAEKLATIFI